MKIVKMIKRRMHITDRRQTKEIAIIAVTRNRL
jgi:hypothetical protein